ncbi:MAG TPA: aromatic ring-hydroxylating dioxygenase subunit alpha [Acidimicrobiales bacterium]|nr:aromatic ring-hydroxylating dioxygenase subunit alpha [Acidimicrobiales bacterium]
MSELTRTFASHPALRHYWYPIVRAMDLTETPLAATLLTEAIVLWRGEGAQASAALDRCPHREAPLSGGRVVAGCLECPYHGWSYDGAGRCVLVPSSGPGATVPPRAHLQMIPAVERYGHVWVCLEDPVAGIPEIAEDSDPEFRLISSPVEHWKASATRMVDNFLDISHFPYVHQGTFGAGAEREVGKVDMEDLGDFYGYRYSVVASNTMSGAASSGQTAVRVGRSMTTGFSLPFGVRSTIDYETGLRHVMLLMSVPVDDRESYFAFMSWRNDDFSVPAEIVNRFDRQIGEEDRRMLERIPGSLPLEVTGTVSVQSDKASVEWRRQLRELLS